MIQLESRGDEWGTVIKDLTNTKCVNTFLRSLTQMDGETKPPLILYIKAETH